MHTVLRKESSGTMQYLGASRCAGSPILYVLLFCRQEGEIVL